MMIKIAVLLLLAAAGNASAASPYDEALSALKSVEVPKGKELDAVLTQPDGPAVLADANVASLLGQAQKSLELFRRAAEVKNNGYLFGPKAEVFNSKTPMPAYNEHTKLLWLLLLDAKVASLRKQRPLAERDLLAAVDFILQVSEQKSGALLSAFIEQIGFLKASVMLARSIQGSAPSEVYLKQLSRRLNRLADSQDFLEAAMVQEGEILKGATREGFTPELLAKDQAKLWTLRRIATKRIQDAEYFSMVYSMVDAAGDEQTRTVIAALKRNDVRLLEAFLQARAAQLAARKQAPQLSQWAQVKDALKGGPQTRLRVAQGSADVILNTSTPDYGNTISRYHVFLCELHVLRTALAVELFRRAKRRLPRDLGELVPAYLSAIPVDSFNGFQPLRYAAAGKNFKIYSFGPEGKDNGGTVALDWDAYVKDPARSSGSILFTD